MQYATKKFTFAGRVAPAGNDETVTLVVVIRRWGSPGSIHGYGRAFGKWGSGWSETVTLVVVSHRWGSPGSAGCTRWLWRVCYPGAYLTPLGVTRFGTWLWSSLWEVG